MRQGLAVLVGVVSLFSVFAPINIHAGTLVETFDGTTIDGSILQVYGVPEKGEVWQDNRLFIHKQAGDGINGVGIKTTFGLDGDFDLRVEWHIEDMQSTDWDTEVRLAAMFEGGDWAITMRDARFGYSFCFTTGCIRWGATSDTAGVLRLTRTGDTIRSYFGFVGASLPEDFTEIGNGHVLGPPRFAYSVYLDLFAYGTNDVFSGSFDNFVVDGMQETSFEISSITDVANDQGRQVRINFSASLHDVAGSLTPVLQYEVFRRIDPLPTASPQRYLLSAKDVTDRGGTSTDVEVPSEALMEGWEFVGAVPAHAESLYNIVVPTLADSTKEHGVHWSTFFIRAASGAPAVFWDSPVDSGYSIDNLAPMAPQNLVLTPPGLLTWDEAAEPDFAYFTVYGSTSADLGPDATVLGQTTESSLEVEVITLSYYHVTATDYAGNEGPAASIGGPTDIRLAYFRAARDGGGVVLYWGVLEATDHMGFHVYRQATEVERVRITAKLLIGETDYEYVDYTAPPGATDYWLAEISRVGITTWHGPVTVSPTAAPRPVLSLSAWPNPFVSSTSISYSLPGSRLVRLDVFDLRGRPIATLVDEVKASGQHSANWNGRTASGRSVADGFYVLRLQAGTEVRTQKVVLLR